MIELQSVPKLQQNNSIKVQHYSCFYGKTAFRICANKYCMKPSICCKDLDCICNKTHLDCPQINLQSFIKKLYSKVNNNTCVLQKAANIFDNLIDRVSQISQQTQKIIKRYGLQEEQINFLQYLEDNRENKLTGKIVHEANKKAGTKYEGDFEQIQKCVDKLWSEMDGIIWGVLYSTKDLYEIPLKKSKLNKNSGEGFLMDIINQMKMQMKAVECFDLRIDRLFNKQDLVSQQKIVQQLLSKKQNKSKLELINESKQKIDNQTSSNIKNKNSKTAQVNKQMLKNDPKIAIKQKQGEDGDILYRFLSMYSKVKHQGQQRNQTIKEGIIQQQKQQKQTPSENQLIQDKNQKTNIQDSMFNRFFKPSLNLFCLQKQTPRQICQKLSEVCKISKEEAQKFVQLNRFNLGIQRSTQQIINLWQAKEGTNN